MVKKVRAIFRNKTELMTILPQSYQSHLKSHLNRSEYLILTILINLLQSIKKVSLESLANAFPLPITFEGRRRKIQRFLSIPNLSLSILLFTVKEKFIYPG